MLFKNHTIIRRYIELSGSTQRVRFSHQRPSFVGHEAFASNRFQFRRHYILVGLFRIDVISVVTQKVVTFFVQLVFLYTHRSADNDINNHFRTVPCLPLMAPRGILCFLPHQTITRIKKLFSVKMSALCLFLLSFLFYYYVVVTKNSKIFVRI